MLASVAPLIIRMAFIHVVLIWGTNNTTTDGMADDEIVRREVGSRLVLGARVFYAVLYALYQHMSLVKKDMKDKKN